MSGCGAEDAGAPRDRLAAPLAPQPPPTVSATIAAAALLPHTASLAAMAAPLSAPFAAASSASAAAAAEKSPFTTALTTYPFGFGAGSPNMAAAAAALAAQMYQHQLAAAEQLSSTALGQAAAARQALDPANYPWIAALTGERLAEPHFSWLSVTGTQNLTPCAHFIYPRGQKPRRFTVHRVCCCVPSRGRSRYCGFVFGADPRCASSFPLGVHHGRSPAAMSRYRPLEWVPASLRPPHRRHGQGIFAGERTTTSG